MSADSRTFARVQRAMGMCLACCPHGAMCTESPGHNGLHASEDLAGTVLCRWEDGESISREAADALIAQQLGGPAIVELCRFFEGMVGHGG